ncbi:MAG TPA: LysR family transcriptional regulator [Acidimicrobiales bacterium]|jgi:DNA-binding transcriptional LysR family regulator|nr:LysR family transcriptional regulator [Acidimicrobiales bacterium]
MHINPQRLLMLQVVDSAGGVLAAGRQLHLAPSGVSQHIAALERETGLVLLDRSRRGGQRSATLTAAGRQLLVYATRLAEVIADAETEMTALSGSAGGPIVLAAFPTVISKLAVPALNQVTQTNRGVTPIVREISEQSAIKALHAGEVDIVLVEDDLGHARTPEPGCSLRWLLDDPYRVVIPHEWPVPTALSELSDYPWVDGPPGSAISGALSRLRAATSFNFTPRHTCLEFPAALALVGGGMAVALATELALNDPLPVGVRVIDFPDLGSRRISALFQIGRKKPLPVVTALLDALKFAAHSQR